MSVLHAKDKSVTGTVAVPRGADTDDRLQRAGGVAPLYLEPAYLVAMPYFLIVVDYTSIPPERPRGRASRHDHQPAPTQ